MILTSHAITGAAVASFFPNHPVMAFSIAFVSHFALDAIPHSQYEILSDSFNSENYVNLTFNKLLFLDFLKVGTDGIFGLTLGLLLFSNPQTFWVILGGSIFAILPDFLLFVCLKFPYRPLVILKKFHTWIHFNRHLDRKSFLGFFSQIIFVLIVVFITKYIHYKFGFYLF